MRSNHPAHMISLPKRLELQFGNAPALQSGSGRRAPDRRRVSLRWLFGTVLVGVTSSLLMGGALFAALDGRQQLATAALTMDGRIDAAGGDTFTRGDRVHLPVAVPPAAERVMQVPTMTREGDADVIRKRPFAYASASLSVARPDGADYPPFDPLTVFRASGDDELEVSGDAIYGADIESEVRVRYEPFPATGAALDKQARVSTEEAERIVARARASLTEGGIAVSALPYIDDSRFGLSDAATPCQWSWYFRAGHLRGGLQRHHDPAIGERRHGAAQFPRGGGAGASWHDARCSTGTPVDVRQQRVR